MDRHCVHKKRSSSMYLLAPPDSPALDSCDSEWCGLTSQGKIEDDLDHSRPSVYLNELVIDQMKASSARVAGSGKAGDGHLHAGDLANVERTLHVSSCALIVSLIFAERFQRSVETSSAEPSKVDELRPNHPKAEGPQSPGEDATDEKDPHKPTPAPADDEIHGADLFLLCLLSAHKLLYDEGEYDSLLNSDLAEAGRRKKKRINRLEWLFYQKLGWGNLFVSLADYSAFVKRLEHILAARAISQPGRCVQYQDMDHLWDVLCGQCRVVLGVLFRVILGFTAVYAAATLAYIALPVLVSHYSLVLMTVGGGLPTHGIAHVQGNASTSASCPSAGNTGRTSSPPYSGLSLTKTDMPTWVSPFANATLERCRSCSVQHLSPTHPTSVDAAPVPVYAIMRNASVRPYGPAVPQPQLAAKLLL